MRYTLSIIIISAIFLLVSIGNVNAANYRPITWEEQAEWSGGYIENPTYAYDNNYNDTSTYAGIYLGGYLDKFIAYTWDTDGDGTSNATLYFIWEVIIRDDVFTSARVNAWNYVSGNWDTLYSVGWVEDEYGIVEWKSLNIAPNYINSTGEIKIQFGFWYYDDFFHDIHLYDTYISVSDVTRPTVTITSPQDTTYNTDSVDLSFYANEPTGWAGYKLDGGSWTTVVGGSTTLTNLSDGLHKLKVSMADLAGNHGSSIVYFTVDTNRPAVIITSPQDNTTYYTNTVDLQVSANEPIDTWWYSLNSGPDVTFTPNTTITGVEGLNNIIVYATDLQGDVGSSTVDFTIDETTPPTITITTPQNNTTYYTNTVGLQVSADEPIDTWWYSLNSGPDVTFTPSTAITGMEGLNNITVYATDLQGNVGSSTVDFTIDTTVKIDWIEDFESYTAGTFPYSNWSKSGNSDSYIDNSKSVSGNNSLLLYGRLGACNAAVAHREFNVSPNFDIEFYVYNGPETLSGCHSHFGHVNLKTGPSWSYNGRVLITFHANPYEIRGGGLLLGTYLPATWYKVNIIYETVDPATIRLSYWINDEFQGSNELPSHSYESGLKYFTLESGAGTTWFDDVKITHFEPTITITSPQNTTYSTNTVDLQVSANGPIDTWWYSLNSGPDVTFTPNTTITGVEGLNNIVVYATDLQGYVGSSTVDFTIDTIRPTVTITSPQDSTYSTNSVELSFYANEPTKWAGYKLDKGPWVTVVGGSTTLTNLSDGRHKVRVSMTDLAGNHGSAKVRFNIRVSKK